MKVENMLNEYILEIYEEITKENPWK